MSGGSWSIDVEDDVAFGRGHAGRRLVEQQHLGLERERDGDLDQALAAVGQLAHRPPASSSRRSVSSSRCASRDHVGWRRPAPEQGGGDADALGDRHADVLEHGQAAEQLVDLERAGDAALDPLRLRESA